MADRWQFPPDVWLRQRSAIRSAMWKELTLREEAATARGVPAAGGRHIPKPGLFGDLPLITRPLADDEEIQ